MIVTLRLGYCCAGAVADIATKPNVAAAVIIKDVFTRSSRRSL
jgi:hypothetical protein